MKTHNFQLFRIWRGRCRFGRHNFVRITVSMLSSLGAPQFTMAVNGIECHVEVVLVHQAHTFQQSFVEMRTVERWPRAWTSNIFHGKKPNHAERMRKRKTVRDHKKKNVYSTPLTDRIVDSWPPSITAISFNNNGRFFNWKQITTTLGHLHRLTPCFSRTGGYNTPQGTSNS